MSYESSAAHRDARIYQLAAIVDSSDDAIVSKDLNGIVRSWNRAAEEMFGYRADEIVGKSIRMIIPPDRQDEEDEVLRRIRRGDSVDHYETIRMRKDGTRLNISLSVSPVRDDTGEIIGASKIARNITERKQTEQQLAAANRMKDEFIATLSHELRTPLNAVLGYSRLLRSGSLPLDRRDHAVAAIERNATALTQIVEDVLDMSSIVAGKMRLQVQSVDIAKVIREAYDTVVPAAIAKSIEVTLLLDPIDGIVSGDPDRLQQVIWNLLSNAVKFTPKHGRVQVRLERVNSHLEVVVSDNGAGIPAEFLPHLFERFQQADAGPSRRHGGLGLGLAITRHIVEMHGGTVTAASDGEGTGSTFRIRLPLRITHSEHFPERERIHPRATVAPPNKLEGKLTGVRVLAVDDDREAVGLLKEILETVGAEVRVAFSATEAVEVLQREHVDVMVADIGMPDVDGFELIRRIRQLEDPVKRRVPATALTAFARSIDRAKALHAGFELHLAKPIDPSELVAAVRSLVRRK
jgi:PAS domain S-box-containing protein